MTPAHISVMRVLLFLIVIGLCHQPGIATAQTAIRYSVRISEPASHEIEVHASLPASGRTALELMMPTWSPGYYRVENYAAHVHDVRATGPDGRALVVEQTSGNHWRVQTAGARTVDLHYGVFCNETTVTTNYVGPEYAVLNGAPTFITLADKIRRPHEVLMDVPGAWTQVMTGLDDVRGSERHQFRAADYEELVDSPIVAGRLAVRRFDVDGKPHFVVGVGDASEWDGDAATRDLQVFVRENLRFWGFLPYKKYVFQLLFRPGGGGLEHRNSNLSTVVARRRQPIEGTSSAAGAGWPSFGLVAHEYFHLFNVKRLRPVELGPFDFEKAPTTSSLWIAEGVTSYYSGLLVARAGLQTIDEHLAALSSLIGGLQTSPGRLLQSVAQSSLEVWQNSNSGVNPNANTVSYYNKGQVIGLLLDAKIRRLTDGRRSLDDVMRVAYQRFAGNRGYTAGEFREVAERTAGVDLGRWFASAVESTEELDYSDLLEWYGLRFGDSDAAASAWRLSARTDQTPAQRQHVDSWLSTSGKAVP